MLDQTHQPSARHLARLRMSATERNLPPVFADIAAQRPKMTVARFEAIAPALTLIAELAKTNRLNSQELEKAVMECLATLGDDVPATDPAVESLAREAILNLIADRDSVGGRTHEPTLVGHSWDRGQGLHAKMVDGLTARIDPRHKPTMGAEFAGMSMGDMAMHIARAAGHRPANIPGVTPHTLRHTAITWAMQRGATLTDAVSYFGLTAQTLQGVYWHHHPDHQKTARAAMERKS